MRHKRERGEWEKDRRRVWGGGGGVGEKREREKERERDMAIKSQHLFWKLDKIDDFLKFPID